LEVEADVDAQMILPDANYYRSFFISKVDYSSNHIELFPNSSNESINDNALGDSYILSGSDDPTSKNLWFAYLSTDQSKWVVKKITDSSTGGTGATYYEVSKRMLMLGN
jgi:hypothetical protein